MKLRLFALALATSLVLRAADAPPTFNATLTVGKEHRFILISTAGQSSPFLKLGESFEGYSLKTYDAKAAALDLERDGKIVRVTLAADAAVENGTPASAHATIADAEALMNKIHIDEMVERSIALQKTGITASVSRIGANFPKADPADVAVLQKNILDVVNASLDPALLKGDITRAYSETFSKSELEQISAFYDTPLGQVLVSKQPEVQQKIQTAMLPRMQEIGPKIQSMARDFAIEQKSKMSGAPAAASVTTPAGSAPAPKP